MFCARNPSTQRLCPQFQSRSSTCHTRNGCCVPPPVRSCTMFFLVRCANMMETVGTGSRDSTQRRCRSATVACSVRCCQLCGCEPASNFAWNETQFICKQRAGREGVLEMPGKPLSKVYWECNRGIADAAYTMTYSCTAWGLEFESLELCDIPCSIIPPWKHTTTV